MKIAIGNDHAGYELKRKVKERLTGLGHEVIDLGTDGLERVDYPRYARKVGKAVASGEAERGIVLCGTGMGVCMAANKIRGVRATLPYNDETARLFRMHNDSNILCMGGRTFKEADSLSILDIWLETEFEGGRHAGRIDKIEPEE